MEFQQIKSQLADTTIQEFINYLNQHKIEDYNEYLLFLPPHLTEFFFQSLEYLASSQTLTKEKITEDSTFQLFGQTIDGDYLGATDHQTLIIPVSLITTDIECYALPAIDFLIQWQTKKITSTILAPA